MLTASTASTAPAHGTAGHTASATASDAEACALGNVFAWMVVLSTHDRLKRRNAARIDRPPRFDRPRRPRLEPRQGSERKELGGRHEGPVAIGALRMTGPHQHCEASRDDEEACVVDDVEVHTKHSRDAFETARADQPIVPAFQPGFGVGRRRDEEEAGDEIGQQNDERRKPVSKCFKALGRGNAGHADLDSDDEPGRQPDPQPAPAGQRR